MRSSQKIELRVYYCFSNVSRSINNNFGAIKYKSIVGNDLRLLVVFGLFSCVISEETG